METLVQDYLRDALSRRQGSVVVGPFLAAFDAHSDNPYRNYALPTVGAEPSPGEVRALVAAFAERGRTPRLEYVPATAPSVEGALLAAGFVPEGRLPLMVVTPEGARDVPVPPGIALDRAETDERLLAAAAAQNAAYGESPPTRHDLDRLRATVAAGGIVAVARDAATGQSVAGGLCSPPHGGVTEIAAIGVVPAYRRRGVAGALCARLAAEAFAAGIGVPFLMAVSEDEARVYARAGFVRAGEILHISRPS